MHIKKNNDSKILKNLENKYKSSEDVIRKTLVFTNYAISFYLNDNHEALLVIKGYITNHAR